MVLPTTLPSIKMFTVLPGSAVPLTGGSGLFVTEPSAGLITTGAGGAVVSTTQVKVAGVVSTLPAASIARTSKVWVPSARPV